MEEQITQFDAYVVLHHDSLGHPGGHARALESYRDGVIRPSMGTLDKLIKELEASDDDLAGFELADLLPLRDATVEGYLLTVQSMWERGLRDLLTTRARKFSKAQDATVAIQTAVWSGGKGKADLLSHFNELLGLSLRSFKSFPSLDLLQLLGNALRHGSGPSMDRLQQIRPQLSISNELLERMIDAVCWFWDDLEYMRCNSFLRKHPSTSRTLEKYLQRHNAKPEAGGAGDPWA